jgi:hypothetical protein
MVNSVIWFSTSNLGWARVPVARTVRRVQLVDEHDLVTEQAQLVLRSGPAHCLDPVRNGGSRRGFIREFWDLALIS